MGKTGQDRFTGFPGDAPITQVVGLGFTRKGLVIMVRRGNVDTLPVARVVRDQEPGDALAAYFRDLGVTVLADAPLWYLVLDPYAGQGAQATAYRLAVVETGGAVASDLAWPLEVTYGAALLAFKRRGVPLGRMEAANTLSRQLWNDVAAGRNRVRAATPDPEDPGEPPPVPFRGGAPIRVSVLRRGKHAPTPDDATVIVPPPGIVRRHVPEPA